MSNRMLVMMMGFVGVLILAVAAIFIAVLAGSGGDDDTPGSPSDNNTPRPGGSAAAICEGNILITYGFDPLTVLDPIQVRDVGTAEYVIELFGGLVTLDLNLEVVPDIARDWQISSDGTIYTFTLRDDVLFHNGRRVTAEDFKYSIERAADPANNSPTVLLYLSGIKGIRDKYTGQATEVEGVRVIDDRTVQIELTGPRDVFLSELTYPVAFVVDREQVDSDPRNWTRQPNGTGPFRMKKFSPAEEIILVRNDRYHLGAPKIQEVVFSLSGGSLLTRYENDEIHISPIPAFELEGIQDGSDPLSADYHQRELLSVSYIAFNASQAPFDDENVRKAFAHASNIELINEVLALGTQRVAQGITPPNTPGYDSSISTYPYDPELAREFLSQSPYAANMPRIILTFSGTAGAPSATLEALQQQWEQNLGIRVELQASDASAFLRELRRGTFQMYTTGWIADYPDSEDFVDKLFASDSQQNEFGYDNPEVDALIFEARTELNRERRYQLLAEAEQRILDDAIVIPVFWGVEHLLVKPCVKNWIDVGMSVPFYRHLEIRND